LVKVDVAEDAGEVEHFVCSELRKGYGPFPFASFSDYESWKLEMGILKTFWCGEEELLGYLVARESGEILGFARALKVPVYFFEKRRWPGLAARGEIQDIVVSENKSFKVCWALLSSASQLFAEAGLEAYGVSVWRGKDIVMLAKLGLKPYARSVLMSWNTSHRVGKVNENVSVEVASPSDIKVLRSIQKRSWGFFIRPNFEKELVLLAFLGKEPVGLAYLNKRTGNLDFGVHVVPEHRRKYVGSTIVTEALKLCRKLGFERMYVVRALRLTKFSTADKVALQFYTSTRARVVRFYYGFREARKGRTARDT